MTSPVEVSISSCAVPDTFEIHVSLPATGHSWAVQRQYAEFLLLRQELQAKKFIGDGVLQPLTNDAQSLQSELHSLLMQLMDKLWFTEPMLSFLEDVPKKSVFASLQIAKLTQQVDFLTNRSMELESHQMELQQNYLELLSKIKSLSGVDLSPPAPTFPTRNFSMISQLSTDSVGETSTTVTTLNFPSSMHGGISDGQTYMSDDDAQAAFQGARSPLLSGENSASPSPQRGSLEPIPEYEQEAKTHHDSDDIRPDLPLSPYFPHEFFPLSDVNVEFAPPVLDKLNDSMEDIIKLVAPTEEQLQHRTSIVNMLKRQLRLALNATALEVGLSVTHCLMPNDPIKLTVVIGKSVVVNWHLLACEQLSSFAEKLTYFGSTSAVPHDEDETIDAYFTDCQVSAGVSPMGLQAHAISNITHSKQSLMHVVHCMVDNIPVEIHANARTELCMLAFFEECAQLIGKDNLFKRSFLLIRAWWALETQAFVGCSIRHYLTDHQLFVMLLEVFNRYNEELLTPLQALSLFLAEFSVYDGAQQAITIQGIVGFQTRTSNQPNVLSPNSSFHVANKSVLEKHWLSYNISRLMTDMDSPTAQQIQKKRSTSSEEAISMTSGVSASVSTTISNLSAQNGMVQTNPLDRSPEKLQSISKLQQQLLEQQQRELMESLSTNNLYFFDRGAFNVVHPLCHSNMIVEKLSQRRISKLYKAFQLGASNLAYYLKRSLEPGVDPAETLRGYFPTILTQAHSWNTRNLHDVSLAQLMNSNYELSKIELDVSYCNLMTESIVSDDALKVLAMEILAMKGPLPVGEIGKILAELTSIPSLSLKLKEKFGGLKKFLEQYPANFVVSNDHPFNPNVLLRCTLSAEHLELIDKGIFPHQLLIKSKKAAAASAKKKKSNSITGSSYPTNAAPGNTSPSAMEREMAMPMSIGAGHVPAMYSSNSMNMLNSGYNNNALANTAPGYRSGMSTYGHAHSFNTNMAAMNKNVPVNYTKQGHANSSNSLSRSQMGSSAKSMSSYGSGMQSNTGSGKYMSSNGSGYANNGHDAMGYASVSYAQPQNAHMDESHLTGNFNANAMMRSVNANGTANSRGMASNGSFFEDYVTPSGRDSFTEKMNLGLNSNFGSMNFRNDSMTSNDHGGFVGMQSHGTRGSFSSTGNMSAMQGSVGGVSSSSFDSNLNMNMMNTNSTSNYNMNAADSQGKPFSVMSNLFPLVLSNEELQALNANSSNSSTHAFLGSDSLNGREDYSALPSGMFFN